jgi:hypothetical protein
MSEPHDVDNLVSSFLSELNCLSDDLGLAPGKPSEEDKVVPIDSDLPSAAPKPTPYRNIDILFMDDGQVAAGKNRTQQEIPHFHMVRDHPRILMRMWAYLRLRCLSGWTSVGASIHRDRSQVRLCPDTREISPVRQQQRTGTK